MRIVGLMLAAVIGCGAAAALAQSPEQGANQGQAQSQAPAPLLSSAAPPATPDTRWSFRRVDDGFVRLDSRTGQVAHCTPVHAGWACQAVAEDRAALEQQIARLQGEVAALKKEIADLRKAPPPPPAPAAKEKEPAVSLRMPTRADVESARDYLASTLSDSWNRLVQMIMHFQHDVLRKDS